MGDTSLGRLEDFTKFASGGTGQVKQQVLREGKKLLANLSI